MSKIDNSLIDQLKELINKPCWFKDGILEIRKNSDAFLSEVNEDHIIIKNTFFEKTLKILINEIRLIERKDLTKKKILTCEDELYDEKLVKAGQLGKEKKYTESIVEAKSLLELVDPNDDVSVLYAVFPIVLGLMSIAWENNKDPDPGTTAYNNLQKYLTILLNAYNHSPVDIQEHYRQFDPYFKLYNELIDLLDNNRPLTELNTKPTKKSGCFIATAVYGSPFASEVIILKEFRDDWLLKYGLGKAFVKFYYWISPSIANQIVKRNYIKLFTKIMLIIPLLKIANYLKRKEK